MARETRSGQPRNRRQPDRSTAVVGQRPQFAPAPLQLIPNGRLKAVEIRVALAIAGHDQLGRNGRGCDASRKRLAEEVGVDPVQVSRAVAMLMREGIIESARNPKDRRFHIYRVKYQNNPWIGDKDVTCSPPIVGESEKGDESVTYSAGIGDIGDPQITETAHEFVSNKCSPGRDCAEAPCSAGEGRPRGELTERGSGAVPGVDCGAFLDNLPTPANTIARRHAANFAEWFDGEPPEVRHALDLFVDVFGPTVIHRALAMERVGAAIGYGAICEAAAAHVIASGQR